MEFVHRTTQINKSELLPYLQHDVALEISVFSCIKGLGMDFVYQYSMFSVFLLCCSSERKITVITCALNGFQLNIGVLYIYDVLSMKLTYMEIFSL